jgi:hypothetical protein
MPRMRLGRRHGSEAEASQAQQVNQMMRVQVLVPTTGALNQVLRIQPHPGLAYSFAVRKGEAEHLSITRQYAPLTAPGGALEALGAPAKPGTYILQLAGPIDCGGSWQLPVLLAHLVVALGEKLVDSAVAEQAGANLVVWSTGAVDYDLTVVHGDDVDYQLRAKVERSRAGLAEAAKAGARIIAIIPESEDPAPLRCLLEDVGARNFRVERVKSASAARDIIKHALGLGLPASSPVSAPASTRVLEAAGEESPPDAVPRTVRKRHFWKITAGAVAVAVLAAAAFTAGRDWLPQLMAAAIHANTRVEDKHVTEAQEPAGDRDQRLADLVRRLQPSHWPHVVHVDDADQPQVTNPAARDTPPDGPAAPERTAPPVETAPREPPPPPPVPVKIQELRAPNGGICLPILVERRMLPSRIDVALDAPDRFHDSAGWNLCGLEWTLNPDAAQSGVVGFDVDLPGFALSRSGATGTPGAWTSIAVEFRNQLSRPMSYNVNVKYAAAPRPEQVQQFRHTITTSRQAGH